ncbi:peptidoglycan-associated lipoprotein [Thermotomaculum hydrothermale]|uniref:Peptidoglycan-associated lipoprotein n=1 Tax=Thermotomaculum hydrothermale TaxID=981385 RepID=A0A7R6PEW9_9BACT|nr:peptidoglycan-associated lipoprotein Pal [Thermotomaculum hydrothermale]BBB32448.1 peptidoglycan-associated lipoprotein [Thermotomaculum hydrothermale]
MRKFFILLLFFSVIISVSCHKKVEQMPNKEIKPQETTQKQIEQKENINTAVISEKQLGENKKEDFESKSVDELNKENILEDVYFEFDKSRLTPETREVLKKHAKWLKEHPSVKILIEGHCDERGTEQYNLALGDRRAHAVKNYLISLGISPDRMKTISFGEMFPKVKGHNEWAWSQNRRCHFVIISK